MCGITGLIETRTSGEVAHLKGVVDRMAKSLTHRGPDSQGTWFDPKVFVGFGHRRLSIVDLSKDGAQPMVSQSGRYVIAFNGEIYNFLELRAEFEARKYKFKGHSDTEVLLASFDHWGLDETLARINGMFAIALWDRELRTLTLIRDRIGEKPLHYGFAGSSFLFASEVRAFHAHPSFLAEVDERALSAYFRYLNVPAPLSIFRGVQKLEAGCLVHIRVDQGIHVGEPRRYWDSRQFFRRVVANRVPMSDDEAVERVSAALADAVKRRTIADVPVGSFLSGGTDSGLVTAFMQKTSTQQANSFSMGVTDPAFDEAPRAKAIAQHLGTRHTEEYVSEKEALDVVPSLGNIYDEPFADSSQIPTTLVSRLARKHVTVVLAGDGGDELFGGYPKYSLTPRIWERLDLIPGTLRAAAARTLKSPMVDSLVGKAGQIDALHNVAERVRKGTSVLAVESRHELNTYLASSWKRPSEVFEGGIDAQVAYLAPELGGVGAGEELMYQDLITSFPDDLLAKVDRASMSASLEVRLPFLDPNVMEAAWSLAMHQRIRGDVTKWALKTTLRRFLPDSLVDGPKKGFSVPIGRWMCGPLRDWVEAMLTPMDLAVPPLLLDGPLKYELKAQFTDLGANNHKVWSAVMYGAWARNIKDVRASMRTPA